MTNSEMRAEIHKFIDQLPDERLLEFLEVVNSIAQKHEIESLKKTIEENYDLLKRLAD